MSGPSHAALDIERKKACASMARSAAAAITGCAICWVFAGNARAAGDAPDAAPAARATIEPATAETGPRPATFWGEVWDYLYNGASVTVGLGTREADLQVADLATNAQGKISQRNTSAYFLSYSTRPSFIGRSKFGYNFAFNYTTFTMDQQEVSKNDFRDIGTRVHGRVAYVVPTFFYQVGEYGPRGTFVRLGVGLGIGVAKYEGDIILDYPNNATPVTVSNGRYDLKTASSLYLEGRYRNWGLTLIAAGPTYQDDRYKYSVLDLAAYFGYTYYF